MMYLPKKVYELVADALVPTTNFTEFMSYLHERKTKTFAEWIRKQESAVDLVDIFYNKKEIAPIPDDIPFEEATKALMDGKTIQVIGSVSYEERFRTCYYKGKFYIYIAREDVWKISKKYFDWYGSKFVDTGQVVDLEKMQIAGVNWK